MTFNENLRTFLTGPLQLPADAARCSVVKVLAPDVARKAGFNVKRCFGNVARVLSARGGNAYEPVLAWIVYSSKEINHEMRAILGDKVAADRPQMMPQEFEAESADLPKCQFQSVRRLLISRGITEPRNRSNPRLHAGPQRKAPSSPHRSGTENDTRPVYAVLRTGAREHSHPLLGGASTFVPGKRQP